MSSNKNKKHHFVPECYLKNFIVDKDLFVLDIEKVKKGYLTMPKRIQPGGICYLEDYYKIDNNSEVDQFNLRQYEDLFIEQKLLTILEGKFAILFEKIIDKKELELNEAIDISDFIILMKLRNPYWFNETIQKNKNGWIDSIMQDLHGKAIVNPRFKRIPDEIKKIVVDKVRDFNKDDESFSKKFQLFSLTERQSPSDTNSVVRKAIVDSEWLLFQAPKPGPFFITSDNPGFASSLTDELIYNTRFTDGFAFHFPLSPNFCLVITDIEKDFSYSKNIKKVIYQTTINEDMVLRINDREIQRINKLLIASDDWYLKQIGNLNKPKPTTSYNF